MISTTTMKTVKEILRKEFGFFDLKYFQTRTKAGFKWFMSGHGVPEGYMPLSQPNHDLQYGTLIDETVLAAQK